MNTSSVQYKIFISKTLYLRQEFDQLVYRNGNNFSSVRYLYMTAHCFKDHNLTDVEKQLFPREKRKNHLLSKEDILLHLYLLHSYVLWHIVGLQN